MNAHARALPTALLGATIAILAVVAAGPRAGAVSASVCTASSGVTVIVDFRYFNREIERGCAPGAPATAVAALHAAGFETAGTTQYGDAFVCRIERLPTAKTEACAATPPARSSWSFYSASPTDAAWTYSPAGVLSYQPPTGTIVAFAFGNRAQPGIRPSAATATPPTTVTVAPAVPTTARPTPTAASTNPPVTVAPSSSTTASPRPPETATTSTTSSTSTTTLPRVVDRTFTESRSNSNSGSPLPAVLTVALVVLLGAGAGVTLRARRRRAE